MGLVKELTSNTSDGMSEVYFNSIFDTLLIVFPSLKVKYLYGTYSSLANWKWCSKTSLQAICNNLPLVSRRKADGDCKNRKHIRLEIESE